MILGIESSCDETALSLFDPGAGFLGEWVRSQIESHADYGGVVPDLAVSEHLANFPSLLDLVRGQYEMPGKISKIADLWAGLDRVSGDWFVGGEKSGFALGGAGRGR